MGLFNTLSKEIKNNHLNETKKWVILKEEEHNNSIKLPPINR